MRGRLTDGRGRELEADLGICGTLGYDSGSWQVCGAGGLVNKCARYMTNQSRLCGRTPWIKDGN